MSEDVEIPQYDKDVWARSFERIIKIRKAIVLEANATGNHGGEIDCPACKKGRVRWSMARSNGHVHAQCSTPDCAAWME